MTRQVTTYEPTLPGLLPNVEAARLADSFRFIIESHEALIDRMPTVVERQMLASRSASIDAALAPLGRNRETHDAAAEALADLFVAYGIGRADKKSGQTVTVYLKHLEGVPLFALIAAVDDVKYNRVYDVHPRTGDRIPLDKDFPPSSIRLRSVAEKHVSKLYEEKLKFDRVLKAKRLFAPPINEAERAKVLAGLQELSRQLGGPDPAEQHAAHVASWRLHLGMLRRSEDILGEYAARGLAPVRAGRYAVSPELARKLGPLRPLPAPEFDDAPGGWNRDDER